MVGYFALGYTSWVFLSWFYLYMAQARGLDLKTSAEFTMMPFVCMTVFCLGGGFTSDFLTRTFGLRTGRCYLASLSMLLTAIFLTVGSRVPDAFTAAVVLALGAGSQPEEQLRDSGFRYSASCRLQSVLCSAHR